MINFIFDVCMTKKKMFNFRINLPHIFKAYFKYALNKN